MKHTLHCIACLLVVCLSMIGCAGADDSHFVSLQTASRLSPLLTFDALNAKSTFIFKGACLTSEAMFQNDTLYTLSEVEIQAVFKGDGSVGDVVSVVEMGGRTTVGAYRDGCHIMLKAGETGVSPWADDDAVTIGMYGFYPMQEGDTVLLFTADSTGFLTAVDGTVYSIVGVYEGKFYPQADGTYQRSASEDETGIFDIETVTITPEELSQAE